MNFGLSSGSSDSSSGWSSVLQDLISTAGSAYNSYSSQGPSGFSPLVPGTYVNPQGQVITANAPISTSTMSTLLVLGVLAAIFFFAFNMLRK